MKFIATLILVLTISSPALADDDAPPSALEFAQREARIENRILHATKEKDIILLNCLRTSMADLKTLHKIGIVSLAAAAKAHSQENGDLEEHHLSKVKIVEKESLKILAASLYCVGTSPGNTVVRVLLLEPEFATSEEPGPFQSPETSPPDASPLD